jgi:hypothetical protein
VREKRPIARLFALCATAALACVVTAPARSAPRLLFGFADNAPLDLGIKATAPAGALGARGYEFTLTWRPGKSGLSAQDASGLSRAVAAVAKTRHPAVRVTRPGRRKKHRPKPSTMGGRVIVVIQTFGSGTPLDDAARNDFCTYARSVVASFPRIKDIVIGNEANDSFFWRPQYNADGSSASPAAYESLLARCYDVLHAFRPTINVGGMGSGPAGNDNPGAYSNISHAPTTFIRGVAAAYRASGRTRPIFDTVVHHPYGADPAERPYLSHTFYKWVGEGDWSRLVSTYREAFAHTTQSVPGRCLRRGHCASIWYLESGFQTTTHPGAPLYHGYENVNTIPDVVGKQSVTSSHATTPAPDQATQIRYALRLAYCQPYVGAIFNFLLRDDPNLAGYQSGLLWADWTPKGSYGSVKRVVANVNSGNISCARPRPPTAVIAQAFPSPAQVSLTWKASLSPIGVSIYSVYRNGRLLGTTPWLEYVDLNVVTAGRYTYTVRGRDAAGKQSRPSRAAVVTIP